MSAKDPNPLALRLPEPLRALASGALHMVFPPRCICCGEAVASDFGLCPDCWRETGFIGAVACDCCGTPLPGQADPGERLSCDDCLTTPRPWARGRAALSYGGAARRMILGLKHGDRLDLARPLGGFLSRAAADLACPGMIVAPIPLHRLRLIRRRYNQSALLARVVAKNHGLRFVPDLLVRDRHTPSQEGKTRDERLANVEGAISVRRRYRDLIAGQRILLIDDVMTSGATFTVASEALLAAGASELCIAALARVAKDA